MFGGQGKESIDVVTIDSSDDEGGATVGKRNTSIPSEAPLVETKPLVRSTGTNHPSASSYAALESRSFWKAGNYSVGPTRSAALQGELEHARVHPKFLHSNATSHKWAFGAIAELLDNAVDEICNGATFVKVDRIYNLRDNSPALLFQDNGGGMDPGCLRKCMSLGYSSKKANTRIGQYGNGFKTSTMRLGADVIVLSRAARGGKETQSAGLLSYTFLRKTGQDDVMVPMVDFDISTHWAEPIIYSSQDDWSTNLKTILEWSPFASKDELMLQFEDIGSHGTKIIIYNLWLNDEGIFELNFDDDDEVLVETTIGFLKEAPAIAVSGFNVYHKNRLIRPFWKVTSDGSSKGNGVVGVLEANFIEPAHDKQDFERSSLFIRLEMRMKQMVADYWKGHCHFIGFKPYDPNLRNMQKEHPVQHPARHMANVQKQLLNVNYNSGLSRTSTHDGLPAARPTGHATVSVQEPASVNCSRSALIDRICEENIHLFMRCEEQIEKEKELKETVETLEKQLEQTKRKCARLSVHLESRRKQKEIRPKKNF